MIRSLLGKKFPVSRLALTLGLSSSLLALGHATAQQVSNPTTSQAPETAEADRVTVTGSNIPTSQEVGEAPVDTVDQAARDRTGQEDVLSVLTRATPAISAGGGNLGSSNASVSSGSTLGGSAVAIHGLPTLVLLDGRRLTDSSAAAAGGGAFTDVNLFPSALVKRIEVLKDGASAIYGTEAVGGVINVILDQEFQGFEFSTRYGFTEKGDTKDQRFSGIFGFGDDKTHLVIGAEYVNQDPIRNSQRDFSSPSFGTTSYAGVIRLRVPSTTAGAFRQAVFTEVPGVNSPNDVVAPGSIPLPTTGQGNAGLEGVYTTGGINVFPASAAAVGATSTRATNGFDLSRATTITLDQNRLNVFASGDRQLIGNHVVAFVDFLYASNYSQSQLNAQPLSNNTGVVIPAGAPFNPFAGTISGANAGTILVANRFTSAARVFRNDANFYRVVAGFKGEIVKNYNYEIALNTSREQITFQNPGLIIASDLNAAIAGGFDAAGNAVPATFNADGTTLTPAGPFSTVRGVVQPALDFFARNNPAAALQNFTGNNIRFLESKFQGVDGKLVTFPVTLPGGPLGFVVGGEYRHEFLKAQDSPEVFVGSVPIGNINTGRDVFALFAETRIPLVSPDMHVPGVYSADLNGAGRFENFSDSGSAWVPKVGFTLRPIQDIALRGTFSKSFVAPTIYQTRGPSSNGFTGSYDIGGGPEQAQSAGGANPNLASTRADTYTAGIVISPHQVPGLTLNGDFFHVEETRLTGSIDPIQAITSVNQLGQASPFNSFVHRDSFTGPTNFAVGELAGNAPTAFVLANQQNLGGARIAGVDFGIHYAHDFGNPGQINIGLDGTYFLQYKSSTLKGTNFDDVIGYYTGQAGLVSQYRLTPVVEYKIRGFTASALGNYIPSARDAHNISIDTTPGLGGTNPDKESDILNALGRTNLPIIRDYYTIDVLLSYEFLPPPPADAPVPAPKDGKDSVKSGKDGKDGKTQVATSKQMAESMFTTRLLDGLKLSFGIDNVTNARPSRIAGSPDSTNTDASIYDPYQRRYYFVVSKRF